MNFGIWNSLDEVALYLGLERLDYETDEAFYNRIKKFTKWKYQTNYRTQAHSIPIQLGLDLYNIAEISHSNPEKIFKCEIDWEYLYLVDEDDNFIRTFINTEEATIKKVADLVNASGTFIYTLIDPILENFPAKYLIRGKNFRIDRYFVNSKNTLLGHKNIIPSSFSSEDVRFCKTRVDDLSLMQYPGDYFLDPKNGYLHLYEDNFKGFFVSYEHYEPRFVIEGSDVSLIPFNITSKYGINDKLIKLLPQLLDDIVWGK